MSILGKYRREEDEKKKPQQEARKKETKQLRAVPNKERKSPIVSFSIPIDLRICLQALRKNKSINLSLWVEKQLREAVSSEFPRIAKEYLE
ncbi:MAG: hypothetical protein PVG65_05935 [Candidatus Thorarchaeota archaeon]